MARAHVPRGLAAASTGASNVVMVGQLGGATVAVDVVGDLAYAGIGPRLAILDMSDPASPLLLGQTAPMPRVLESVTVEGDYAYVAAGDAGLRVVDVSDPADPVEVGSAGTVDYAWDVAVAGDYVYIADGAGGLRVVNVLDPSHPTEEGAYEDTDLAFTGVDVLGSYAYLADEYCRIARHRRLRPGPALRSRVPPTRGRRGGRGNCRRLCLRDRQDTA